MKRVISFLAATFACANSQTVFSDLKSDTELLNIFSNNQSLSPMFKVGNFGTDYRLRTQDTFIGPVLFNNGTHWGTVCEKGLFNMDSANVFCRSLSPKFSAISWYQTKYDLSNIQKPILMEKVRCTGNEQSLDKCQFTNITNCTHSDDIYVSCSGLQWNYSTQGNFRLVNTQNITNSVGGFQGVWGKAEVFNGSQWNAICDDYFNKNSARVFCRSIGHPTDNVEFSNALKIRQKHDFYKHLVLDGSWYKTHSAQCLGTEISMNQCSYTRSQQTCNHYEDVYVYCSYQ